MAAVAGRYLIKLYELANLSSCKGETSHQRSPKHFLSNKAHPKKTRQKESTYGSIPMKASQTVMKPATYGTLQCATSFGGTSPFSAKVASAISSTLGDLQLNITPWNHERVCEFSFPSPFPYLKKRQSS